MTDVGLQRWPVEIDALRELAASRSKPDTATDADHCRAILDGILQGR